MSETSKKTRIDISAYCPALISLWYQYVDEQRSKEGYDPSELRSNYDLSVVVELDSGQSSNFTSCEAPIKKANADHPGAPWVELLESKGDRDRYKVKCHGCSLKIGGFKSTATVYRGT